MRRGMRVSVMRVGSNPDHGPRRERTERLFLPGSQITQNVNVLREDIQVRTDDGNRRSLEVLVALVVIRTLPRK